MIEIEINHLLSENNQVSIKSKQRTWLSMVDYGWNYENVLKVKSLIEVNMLPVIPVHKINAIGDQGAIITNTLSIIKSI